MKNNKYLSLIIVVIIVFIIYLTSFLLINYDNSLNFFGSSANFFKSMIGTFQGAGAIAIITAIIIFFQSEIQSSQEQKKKVYDEKIKLFNNVIDTFQKYVEPKRDKNEKHPIIDQDELRNLYFLDKKIDLVCNEKTINSHNNILKGFINSRGTLYDSFWDDFDIFIDSCREDIGLDEANSDEKLSRRTSKDQDPEIENIANSIFDFDKLDVKQNNDFNNIIVELTNAIVNKIGKNNIDHSTTPTGGCTIKVDGRKLMNIVPKSSFLELIVMRDYKVGYFIPKITDLKIDNCRKYAPYYDDHDEKNPHPSYTVPWGYPFFKIKLKYKDVSKFQDNILELVTRGYNTIKDGKVLSVNMSDHHRLKEIFNNSKSI